MLKGVKNSDTELFRRHRGDVSTARDFKVENGKLKMENWLSAISFVGM